MTMVTDAAQRICQQLADVLASRNQIPVRRIDQQLKSFIEQAPSDLPARVHRGLERLQNMLDAVVELSDAVAEWTCNPYLICEQAGNMTKLLCILENAEDLADRLAHGYRPLKYGTKDAHFHAEHIVLCGKAADVLTDFRAAVWESILLLLGVCYYRELVRPEVEDTTRAKTGKEEATCSAASLSG